MSVPADRPLICKKQRCRVYSEDGPPPGMTAALGPGPSPPLSVMTTVFAPAPAPEMFAATIALGPGGFPGGGSMMTMAMRLADGSCGAETPGTRTIRELVTGPDADGCELATAPVACGAGPRSPLIPPLSITPATSPAAPIAGIKPVT